jgi:hypothetical protein
MLYSSGYRKKTWGTCEEAPRFIFTESINLKQKSAEFRSTLRSIKSAVTEEMKLNAYQRLQAISKTIQTMKT